MISAAGTGAAASHLGGVPLLDRPGQIAYAHPAKESSRRLSKILVDSMRSSHLLQRQDGSLLAGGGVLEVGGSTGSAQARAESESEIPRPNDVLLERASTLSPSIVGSARFSRAAAAVRPMPIDGLPVVGYVEEGLYVAVTHSGITLGPLLASLAAAEIVNNFECDLLAPYRPSRFGEGRAET